MDKPAAVKSNPDSAYSEALSDRREVSIEDWLPPRPDRQLLVIGPNHGCMAGRVERLVQKIGAHDLQSAADKAGVFKKPNVIRFKPTDPFTLPYESGQFDLVICAFVSTSAKIKRELLSEIGRVVSADGHLLIVDYLVPGSRLRGKKARQLRDAGNYINAWMRLRNPQHQRCLDRDTWSQRLMDAQWNIQQIATREVPQAFNAWADCYSPTTQDRIRLRAMLVQAPEKAHLFLTPLCSGDRIGFRMTEVFILAAVAKNTV